MMHDGFKFEYTEGCATTTLVIRTNNLCDSDKEMLKRWLEFCASFWGDPPERETKPDGRGK